MTTIKLIEPAHEYKMYKGKKEILTITKTVTKILSEVRLIDLSKVPAGVLERAKLFGKAIHKATELYDLGKLNEKKLDKRLRPYLEGWKKFRKETGFKPLYIEKPIAAEIYGVWVATTPDRIGYHTDKNILTDVEIKSGLLYRATSIQTMGHKIIFDMQGRQKITHRIGIRLIEGGWISKPYKEDGIDRAVFLSSLSIVNWKGRRK